MLNNDRDVKHTGWYILLTAILLTAAPPSNVNAQSIDLMAGNVLNGAVNGVVLGGATMALNNSPEFDPIRVGVGLGTLYGIGVGVHDLTLVSGGQQFYTSGTFNDATNSSVLVLLDTFYGAAGGVVVASSFTLIAKEPILDGLQYGSAIGAWAGFGFGLIDAFILARRPGDLQSAAGLANGSNGARGIFAYTSEKNDLNIGLIHPTLYRLQEISSDNHTVSVSAGVDLLNIRMNF